jgi:hypothetical protein
LKLYRSLLRAIMTQSAIDRQPIQLDQKDITLSLKSILNQKAAIERLLNFEITDRWLLFKPTRI